VTYDGAALLPLLNDEGGAAATLGESAAGSKPASTPVTTLPGVP
jgi:hypothetical protein